MVGRGAVSEPVYSRHVPGSRGKAGFSPQVNCVALEAGNSLRRGRFPARAPQRIGRCIVCYIFFDNAVLMNNNGPTVKADPIAR